MKNYSKTKKGTKTPKVNSRKDDPFVNLFGGKNNITTDNIQASDRETRNLKKQLDEIKDQLKYEEANLDGTISYNAAKAQGIVKMPKRRVDFASTSSAPENDSKDNSYSNSEYDELSENHSDKPKRSKSM